MERKKKKVNAILTGDWHLREDVPIARRDNFWETQWRKVEWVRQVQERFSPVPPILFAGDMFHHWRVSPILISYAYLYLPNGMRAVWGNHDLPSHSLQLREKSALYTLQCTGKIELLEGTHWKQEPSNAHTITIQGRKILVWHVMTYDEEPPWPGCEDLPAKELLKRYPQFDLIVTGHHHKSFVVEYEGRLLVNPGSLTRQTADQINHEPCIFLWHAEDNTVERVVVPHEQNVLSTSHIKSERTDEMDYSSFIAYLKLHDGQTTMLSFRTLLEQYFQQNKDKVSEEVKNIIYSELDKKGKE